MNNKQEMSEDQKQFILYLKQKYGDKLNESKLQELEKTGQLKKDAEEFARLKAESKKKQAQKAQHGAKLDYIRRISRKCPEGEELYYFKTGGVVGCGCKKKNGGEIEKKQNGGSAVEKFKKARQMATSSVSKIGNTVSKTAKEIGQKKKSEIEQWKEMHRRTTKASGMTKDKDWVEGDKCGGKMKKK